MWPQPVFERALIPPWSPPATWPTGGEHRLAPEDLLRDGHTILLTQLPGPAYSAVARDSDGKPIATGQGESVNEALRRLRPPEAGA
ncbi:hypothetical protein [Nonomuraea sp. NPDC049028]|uniref:hypothetical protein n=1 Tax=Nonomuraea sp. NPDC049028 TaxID=3364348 RepID=UPI00371AB3AD